MIAKNDLNKIIKEPLNFTVICTCYKHFSDTWMDLVSLGICSIYPSLIYLEGI